MRRTILGFFVAFIILPAGYVFAQAAETSRDPVEIFANGKRYPSVHAYKLQRLKDDLRGVLSPAELREFSAQEISAVIREIKTQPPVMAQTPAQEVKAPATDAQIGEMEEMLKDYNAAQNRDNPSLAVDPAKVKTVVVNPSSRDVSSNVQKTDER